MARIELHNQIKAFYSIVFNGEFAIRPTHISLYVFLLNQNNRNMWSVWFKCPFDLAMQGAGINSKTTYYAILDDLVNFKLIEYEKGINLNKAPRIKIKPLTVPKNDTLTDTVSVPLSEPLSGTLPVPLSGTLPDNIIILITNNLTHIESNFSKFEKFVISLNKSNPKEITWRNSYELYLEEARLKYKSILKNETLRNRLTMMFPKQDYNLTMERIFTSWLATEEGWIYNKKKKCVNINWESTVSKSYSAEWHRVYKEAAK